MKSNRMCLVAFATLSSFAYGQAPAAAGGEGTSQQSNTQEQKNQGDVPIYKVQVVSRSIDSVSYRNRSGWTKIDFKGTALAPEAKGKAEVNSRSGYLQVKAEMEKLQPASRYGPEYLTYVLWAITPDGRATNLGEALIDKGGKGELDVTTQLQAFGLIVTAEPYFAVNQPSDVVVMENIIRKDTVGKVEQVNAKYELLQRGQYVAKGSPAQMKPMEMDSKIPLELYEARNAIQLARMAKADQFGDSTFKDAVNLLNQAEGYQSRKAGRKPIVMTSREAVQRAEDSRLIAIRRQRQLALEKERADAAAREAQAQAEADEAARQQKQAEAQAKRDEQRRLQAEQQRLAAEQARSDADFARQQAAAEAAKADRLRQQAEADKNALRAQLLQQFNSVLETRETPRGLIVNMSDVLFDTGKYSLRPTLREKLARLSGIVISHPGLALQVEGFTDITGSDEFNQKLSEQRAATVRDYLVQSGVNPQGITAVGFGKANPIATNDTAAGRKQNRRVEMIVSGEVIGMKIGGAPPPVASPAAPPQPGAAPGAPTSPTAPAGAAAPAAPPAPSAPAAPAAPPQ